MTDPYLPPQSTSPPSPTAQGDPVYHVSEEDFVRAHALSLRRKPMVLLVTRVVPFLLIASGLWSILTRPAADLGSGVFFALLGGVGLVLLNYVYQPRQIRRAYRAAKALHGAITLRLDRQYIHCLHERGSHQFEYDEIVRISEDERVCLLHIGGNAFHLLVKGGPGMAEAIALIKERVAATK